MALIGDNENIFNLLSSSEEKSSRARRINGLVVGIVTDNKKDPVGRIKVKFPWLSENNETDWIRVCSFMTGSKMGTFFLPEIGDEVLVGFIHGDIDRPIVIGSLWNKEDPPPITNDDGKNNIRVIKSRNGHEIILDDTDNKENVKINTKSGHQIIMDDSIGRESIKILDKNNQNSIEIDSVAQSIEINSKMNLKLKSTNIQIESDGMMTLKSKGLMKIKGSVVMIN